MWWIAAVLALVLALATAACTAAILRRLPLPADEPGARPYAELVSRRLLLIMLVCSLAALLVSLLLSPPQLWPVWGVLGTLGVLLAVIDAHTGLLPLRLTRLLGTLLLLAVAVTAALRADPTPLLVAVLTVAGAGILFRLFWQIGGGIGFGDVRLAALVAGAAGATSLQLAVWSLLLGGLAGVLWGLVTRIARRTDGPFPYGPSLVIGPYLALLLEWVLTLTGTT